GAPGPYRLTAATIRFEATGLRVVTPPPAPLQVAGFNFKQVAGIGTSAVAYFSNFYRTRAIYTNDVDRDSGALGPFYYTVTNTTSRSATFGTTGQFPTGVNFAQNYYWTTNAQKGQPWNGGAPVPKALRNANSAFPDDLYQVTVTAADLANNTGSQTVLALLDNWEQKIFINPTAPAVSGGSYVITKGVQFLPNYDLHFYAGPAVARPTAPPTRTLLRAPLPAT